MSNNSKNYASTFIDSMAIIANATTSNLAFDKTIECEVTNADKRDENRYIVKSDNAQFEAFSTADKTYYVHDIVYVTVPGGDFSKQKFIVGRKTDDNDASTVYNLKFPFDDFVKLKKVDMNFSNQPWGFWANKEEDERMPKNQANKIIPRSAILLAESVLEAPVTGLTSLGIQVDVSCFLAAYYPRMGTYGLQIDVMGTIRPSEEHEAFDTERSYTFLNSDMYGNSYAYYQSYQQQKVLDLSTFQSISAIRVYFIQEYNFFDDANIYIPVSDNANIFFENLEIYLGLTNSQLDDEQLFLYTYDSLYFKTINEEEQRPEFLEHNEKVINFQWVHIKDDKTGTILFNKPQDIEDFNNALWEEICGDAVIEDTEAPERIAYNNRELHVYWYEEDLSMSADGTELSEALGKSYGGPRWRQLTFDRSLAEGDNAFAYKYYPPLVIQTNEYGQEIESLEDAKKRTPEYFTGFELKTDVGCALTKRRFKAAVVFGNNKYFSSILTFQNFDTIDSGHSQGITDNADMILKSFIGYYDEAGDYYIEEDKSGIVGRFYVYDENDNVLMDTFGRKYSDINYYVQVWRKNPDGSASYIPLFGNELDFTVTWNFQREYTMIENYIGNDTPYSLSIEDIKAFAFLQVLDGIDTLPDNPHTDFDSCHEDIQILLKTTQKFRIKGILVDQWRRNDITAIVSEEHINYYAHKNFQFGQMGSQGSSYTAAIVIEESEAMDAQGDVLGTYADAYILNNSNFKLRCDVYDLDNKLITGIEGYTFTWELLNPEQCKISSSREDGQTAIGPYFYGHYNAGASTQAPAFKVTIKGVCEWDLIAKRGFLTAPLLRQYNIFVPDRIEYKSDGTIPYYYQNFFTIEKLDKENNKIKKVLLYPTWQLTGPARIQLIEKKVPEAKVELGYQQKTVVSEHKEYALLVGKENESHSWSAHFDTETIHLSTSIDGAPVRQAIVQDQNVYSSSLVNTWDGITLTLDSSTGSILANRIAAGTKSNNKFTGVMMGDWNPYGDRSIDITGIYGFQDGQQSFGFLKDGTGFIGTAGSGQIKFDGRTAMISSSILNENNQPRCYINLNPATIEFEKNENGSIKLTDGKPIILSDVDESTNTSSSQYFLYCEIPRANEAQDELQKSWINTFKETADSNYDYFIVDPNRGVMTTGGIIGKYGYIGDWLLDRGGLSWYSSAQNNPKDENGNYLNPLLTEEKFYDTIYLGNQERNPYTHVIEGNDVHKYGSENYKYLISAGRLNEDTFISIDPDDPNSGNTGDMNFGVTADGHLFSKSGLIGGWHITDKALYSGERRNSVSDNAYLNTHAILLDAESKVISFNNRNIVIDGINAKQQFFKVKDDNDGNPIYAILIDGQKGIISLCDGVITLDGATGTATFGKMEDGIIKGTINLAGYQVKGSTGEESYSNLLSTTKTTELTNDKADSFDFAMTLINNSSSSSEEITISEQYTINSISISYGESENKTITPTEWHTDYLQNNLNQESQVINGKKFLWVKQVFEFKPKEGSVFSITTNPICLGEKLQSDINLNGKKANYYLKIASISCYYDVIGTSATPDVDTSTWTQQFGLITITKENPQIVTKFIFETNSYTPAEEDAEIKEVKLNTALCVTSLTFDLLNQDQSSSTSSSSEDIYVSGNTSKLTGDTRDITYVLQDSVVSFNQLSQWSVSESVSGLNQKFNLGISLQTGLGEARDAEEKLISTKFYTFLSPTMSKIPDKRFASLGTQSNPWDFLYIGESIFINGYAAATEYWVDQNVRTPLWNKIVAVNNLASTAYKKAKSAAAAAQKAANTANEALQQSFVSAKFTMPAGYSKQLVLIRKNGSTLSLAPVPALIHKHKPTVNCTINGGQVTIEVKLSDTSSDGTGKGTFNMADTAFYKKHAYASGGVLDKDALHGGYTERYRNISVSAILAEDGSTLLDKQTYQCTDYGDGYNKGYEAGWAAAANGSGRSGNKVTYPSDTVGSFSSVTASAKLSDTHYAYKTGKTTITLSHIGDTFYTGAALGGSASASVSWS